MGCPSARSRSRGPFFCPGRGIVPTQKTLSTTSCTCSAASELLTRQNRHYINTSCITTPMAGHAQRNVNACVKIIAERKVRIIITIIIHLYTCTTKGLNTETRYYCNFSIITFTKSTCSTNTSVIS